VSGRTFEKAKEVIDAAKREPERYGAVGLKGGTAEARIRSRCSQLSSLTQGKHALTAGSHGPVTSIWAGDSTMISAIPW
jgi:hypothetical protein